MPAKKPPPKDEKPQKQRFIEAAKKAGVDEVEFERAVDLVLGKPKKAKPK